MYRFSRFSYFASRVARFIAHPLAFLIVFILVIVWLVTGPLVGFNTFWQVIFSSSTTVVTFLLLFLIQHTQAREMAAVQLKLNEVIRASEGTHNALLDIEQLTDRDYDQIRENYSLLAKQAREQIKDGNLRWATARIQMESLDSLLDPSKINTDAAIQEPERIDAVRASGLLDRSLEEFFDGLTRVAAKSVHAPVVLVSLVEQNRQWFAGQAGLAEPYCSLRETPLSHSFCKHVVALKKPLIINDARLHPLVKDNPSIAELGVVAYAGVPLVGVGNQVLGSFCAIDHKPRNWSANEISILQALADVAMKEIWRHMAAQSSQSNNSSPAPPHTAAVTEGKTPAAGRGNIMIVDDSATNCKLLSYRLEAEGYSVILSSTGNEALDYLQGNLVDLILLDIMLPGMDGEHVLQLLQSDNRLKQIPVIMISALDEHESVKRCMEMGARDYLLKPVAPQSLQTCIRTHLAAGRPQASAPSQAMPL